MKLVIDPQAMDEMIEHAEATYPYECCGFFYGRDKGDRRELTLARRVRNTREGERTDRFQIEPDDYRKAEQFAQDRDLDLLGVYHSHPDHPAEPSEHDRSVAMPYFSYVIISVEKQQAVATRSWQLNDARQFEEEIIETKSINEKQKT